MNNQEILMENIIEPGVLVNLMNLEINKVLDERKEIKIVSEGIEEPKFSENEVKEIISEAFGDELQNKIVNLLFSQKIFDKLILCLKKDSRFTLLKTSPLLKNPPFGFLEQSDFLNGIIRLQTDLCAFEFLQAMQRYEKKFGRKRSFQDAPRTLDIDIIFFDKKKINSKNLIIPHKNWANRESVIIPLKYT